MRDRVQPILTARDLSRDIDIRLVLLGLVSSLCTLQQRRDLCLQFSFGFEHVPVAHGLVSAGVGLDLGAVHRNRAELDQAHLTGQAHHLHEQLAQFPQMESSEVADRAMRREVVGSQHTKCDIFVQLPGDLARAEHSGGIRVDQHLDHHRRMERLVARTAAFVARVERLQVQAVNRVADEVGQVPLGQPVLQRLRQQYLLLGFVGQIAHAQNLLALRSTAYRSHPVVRFCRADS